ncbi:MAG TPA: tetratricopeptide repeat protein [Candidatus Angelobacter sp.]
MYRTRILKFIVNTLGALAFFAGAILPAVAQVDVRGQIILPDGNIPSATIRFYFTSDDGRVNEIRYTDSSGRFILERLSNRISYTISVDSDEKSYGPSRYSFMPAYEQVVRLTLSPLPAKSIAVKPTVSASSGYKPDPKAVALYDKAKKELKKNHGEAGERLLREAGAADPKYLAPFNELGLLLMRKRRYSEAEEALRQALQADPKAVHALVNLGITRNHLGKYEDAVWPLREALRLDPDLVAAHQHLGIALVETDKFVEAEKELDLAAKSPRSDKDIVQLYRGKLYARTGDFDKSIAAFSVYLANNPNGRNATEVQSLIARMEELKAKRRR